MIWMLKNNTTNNILEVNNLTVCYGDKTALQKVSFALSAGQSVGIIGESGSGKSTLLNAIDGILGKDADVSGSIFFDGQNLLSLSGDERRKLMGDEIMLIFQNPEAFFDPIRRVGRQMEDAIMLHHRISRKEAGGQAESLLEKLSFPDVGKIMRSYPFELSGGMCQRVAIAMAAGGSNTKLILADEPTSALDQLIRRDAADFIMTIKEQLGAALLLVTHDLRLAGQISDVIGVMYRGRMVEWGLRQEILENAVHPYTKSLIRAVPDRESDFSNYERYCRDVVTGDTREQITATHWALQN